MLFFSSFFSQIKYLTNKKKRYLNLNFSFLKFFLNGFKNKNKVWSVGDGYNSLLMGQ